MAAHVKHDMRNVSSDNASRISFQLEKNNALMTCDDTFVLRTV
jgi:hypothetical protein